MTVQGRVAPDVNLLASTVRPERAARRYES
jgi:hypothetical protein